MFLRNWDLANVRAILNKGDSNRLLNKDNELAIRRYDGQLINDSISTNIATWGNFGIEGNVGDSYNYMLWVGGESSVFQIRKTPGIFPEVHYEDYELYQPLLGGTEERENFYIYGQKHIISEPFYDQETDTWKKTVTREFKNISNSTLTIKELGVFTFNTGYGASRGYRNIVAREILKTPIEVQNDSYFKVSWTYEINNPHENREKKLIEYITYPQYSSVSNNNINFTPPEEADKLLLISIYPVPTTLSKEEALQKYTLSSDGWNFVDKYSELRTYKQSTTNDFIRIYLATKKLSGDSTIISKYDRNNNHFLGSLVCSSKLLDINVNESTTSDMAKIQVSKLEEEKNLIWAIIQKKSNSSSNNKSLIQTDEKTCLNDFVYHTNEKMSFYLDTTSADTHTFECEYSPEDQEMTAIKIEAEMDINEDSREPYPLYEYVPIKEEEYVS